MAKISSDVYLHKMMSFNLSRLAKSRGFDDYSQQCFDFNGKLVKTSEVPLHLEHNIYPYSTLSILHQWLIVAHGINTYLYFDKESGVWIGNIQDILPNSLRYEGLLPVAIQCYDDYTKSFEYILQEATNLLPKV